jgi:hypothetical protein
MNFARRLLKRLRSKPSQLMLRTRGRPLAVHRLSNGYLAFKSETGKGGRRCFVSTMPKAGTYFIGRLLREAGLVDLEVHVDLNETSDYRGVSASGGIGQARELTTPLSFEQALSLVHEGQFAVGHIPFSQPSAAALADFSVIVALREPREALVSMMRFEERRMRADPARGDAQRRAWINEPYGPDRTLAFLKVFGAELLDLFAAMLPWAAQKGVLACPFETLIGDDGDAARDALVKQLLATAGVEDQDPSLLLRRTLNQRTLTFSGERTRLDGVWNTPCEDTFIELGGLAVAAGIRSVSRA